MIIMTLVQIHFCNLGNFFFAAWETFSLSKVGKNNLLDITKFGLFGLSTM
jgi:hypothetical protein